MPSVPQHTSDYIRTFEGVLQPNQCQELTRRFENSSSVQVQQLTPGFSFTEVNVSREWPDMHLLLAPIFEATARAYAENIGMSLHWPRHAYEQIRMKRYLPAKGDVFRPHLDVGNHASARRFLVMFLYLNDVEEGGETAFPQWDIAVKAHTGKLLAFPPHYPYLHEGRAPVSGPKYIVGSYCHYL